jgi:hypothetical protein
MATVIDRKITDKKMMWSKLHGKAAISACFFVRNVFVSSPVKLRAAQGLPTGRNARFTDTS